MDSSGQHAVPKAPRPPTGVNPVEGEVESPPSEVLPDTRRGRRPKFSASDDLVIVREVAAAKAHVAGFGDKRERFGEAAVRGNASGLLSTPVTPKSIQHRYTKV